MTELVTSRGTVLTGVDPGSRRGKLKVYLGAAPGTGKTFAMLREGNPVSYTHLTLPTNREV